MTEVINTGMDTPFGANKVIMSFWCYKSKIVDFQHHISICLKDLKHIQNKKTREIVFTCIIDGVFACEHNSKQLQTISTK